MRINTDEKLKTIAKLYAKKEGESLLAETYEIKRQNVSYVTPRADKTVSRLFVKEQRVKRRKFVLGLAATAACVVLAVRIIVGVPDQGGVYPSVVTPSPSSPLEPPATGIPGEIMPISFTLPADYRVMTSDYDKGMSIYRLESESHGEVVLTMYYETDSSAGSSDKYQDFDEVIIDGTPVPAKVRDTYRLLAFEADEIQYTISSEDDLGALAAFYRNIV